MSKMEITKLKTLKDLNILPSIHSKADDSIQLIGNPSTEIIEEFSNKDFVKVEDLKEWIITCCDLLYSEIKPEADFDSESKVVITNFARYAQIDMLIHLFNITKKQGVNKNENNRK